MESSQRSWRIGASLVGKGLIPRTLTSVSRITCYRKVGPHTMYQPIPAFVCQEGNAVCVHAHTTLGLSGGNAVCVHAHTTLGLSGGDMYIPHMHLMPMYTKPWHEYSLQQQHYTYPCSPAPGLVQHLQTRLRNEREHKWSSSQLKECIHVRVHRSIYMYVYTVTVYVQIRSNALRLKLLRFRRVSVLQLACVPISWVQSAI